MATIGSRSLVELLQGQVQDFSQVETADLGAKREYPQVGVQVETRYIWEIMGGNGPFERGFFSTVSTYRFTLKMPL